MRNPLRLTAWAAGAAVLAVSGLAAAAQLNVVRGLDVARQGQDTVVSIAGSSAPVYTVFKLENPRRVVVDLQAADLSAVQAEVTIGWPFSPVRSSSGLRNGSRLPLGT